MILPIYAYGHPVLRKACEEIEPDYPNLQELIDNMFETMYNANGVGLAAPQIGLNIRLFIVDGSPMEGMHEGDPQEMKGFKRVFINPEITSETGEEWPFEEGCLSIPDVRAEVSRKSVVKIKYLDREFKPQEEELTLLKARIIQHEFDHIEGVLFTDHLSPFKKQLLKSKLSKVSKGKITMGYPLKIARKARR